MNVPHRMNLLYSIPEIHRTKILYIIITTKFVNSIPKPIVHKTTLFHPVQHFRKMTQLFEFIPMSSYAYIAAKVCGVWCVQGNNGINIVIFIFAVNIICILFKITYEVALQCHAIPIVN